MDLTAALPRTRTRDLAEWLTEDGQHAVRIERKDHGRTYRAVVAPAPGGVTDWTADWTEIGFYPTITDAEEAIRNA